ncbi:hypothetical protein HRI_004421500 [Hibiscus trionum]|uniref:Spen paralogue and orthologue SPOC C-terminal domain-containing protein n=1 Tax=Hibiscus trionum TaxID=183268 RepID=A0A9W7MJZ5_HIBTR|nr:hypothetical protein HRI_004421500 [Hibiscus trionum]
MGGKEGSGSGNLKSARPTVAEKLWDGSLKLNSSVTVSVVAFFKSGEKMPDIEWSELVEVKGKVRLEAFEKYIQELARSRNRGLMVVSLCWKEGSSKSGLLGLNQISKGYKKGERVGFAQLSPGIDLYICPRSDAIITILAKHGFFKGMAAIEDKKNSLIGCVVWRRNHGPSDSITKKLEKKHSSSTEQPPSSHSEQKVSENDLPCAQPAQESQQVTCTSIESAVINRNEGGNAGSSDSQLALHTSPASADLLLKTSALSNFSGISLALQTSSCSDSVLLFRPSVQSSVEEMPRIDNSKPEEIKSFLGLENPALSLPSVIIKEHIPAIDDDDLPEFDFGAGCGISKTPRSKVLDTSVFEKNVVVEGLKKVVSTFPLASATTQSLPAQNKRLAEGFIPPGFAFNSSLNLPPGKKVCKLDQVSVLPILEAKHTAKSSSVFTPVITGIVAPQKNIFDDDDDDIPEWCPPHVELSKQTFLGSTTVVRTSIHPTLSNPKLRSSSPGHPNPPFPLACQLPFNTQRPSYANQSPVIASVKPPQPRQTDRYIQRAPSSLVGSNSSHLLRPPIHPPQWKGKGR